MLAWPAATCHVAISDAGRNSDLTASKNWCGEEKSNKKAQQQRPAAEHRPCPQRAGPGPRAAGALWRPWARSQPGSGLHRGGHRPCSSLPCPRPCPSGLCCLCSPHSFPWRVLDFSFLPSEWLTGALRTHGAVSACLSKDSETITHLQRPCKAMTTIPTSCAFSHCETQLLFSPLIITIFCLSAHSSRGPWCFNTNKFLPVGSQTLEKTST